MRSSVSSKIYSTLGIGGCSTTSFASMPARDDYLTRGGVRRMFRRTFPLENIYGKKVIRARSEMTTSSYVHQSLSRICFTRLVHPAHDRGSMEHTAR